MYSEPFPLYPGESLEKMESLPVIDRDCAFRLEAKRDFTDENKVKRFAGEEWLEEGPKIYIPRMEVSIVSKIEPVIISSN